MYNCLSSTFFIFKYSKVLSNLWQTVQHVSLLVICFPVIMWKKTRPLKLCWVRAYPDHYVAWTVLVIEFCHWHCHWAKPLPLRNPIVVSASNNVLIRKFCTGPFKMLCLIMTISPNGLLTGSFVTMMLIKRLLSVKELLVLIQ